MQKKEKKMRKEQVKEMRDSENSEIQEAVNIELSADGTSHIEYSIVDNTKYSQEIIEGARAAHDPAKIEKLKQADDLEEFLAESKSQALAMWHADHALAVHSEMFRVQLMITAGEILNDVEAKLRKKSVYMEWFRKSFSEKHLRYFQQAKQLADIGDFAKIHAPAGKNRILALEGLRKVEKKRECLDLFKDFPFPDMTEDEDGQLLKKHIDSVITYHRLAGAGISFATFQQSECIASTLNEAIPVKKAEHIKEWLNKKEESQRKEEFDRVIQDQMIMSPDDTESSENSDLIAKMASLDRIIASLVEFSGAADIENQEWIENQKKIVDVEKLKRAQEFISVMIAKLTAVALTGDIVRDAA